MSKVFGGSAIELLNQNRGKLIIFRRGLMRPSKLYFTYPETLYDLSAPAILIEATSVLSNNFRDYVATPHDYQTTTRDANSIFVIAKIYILSRIVTVKVATTDYEILSVSLSQ
jgi:hypothetical protein